MLVRLDIRQFTLIDHLAIEFSPNLNILTGETGAGKSILIDAIRFVLGERLDTIRAIQNQGSASVEAVFGGIETIRKQYPQILEMMDDDDEFLILRREIVAGGKSRSQINQRIVNTSTLREIGKHLIDIHGQYDHQMLLEPAFQLHMVDRFAGCGNLLPSFEALYRKYADLQSKQRGIEDLKVAKDREMDLLKYQIDEIERAGILDADESSLALEQIKLAQAEKLAAMTRKIIEILEDETGNVTGQLGLAVREVQALEKIDPYFTSLKQSIETIQIQIEELSRDVRQYHEKLSFDPENLEEIQKKVDLLDLLKRKYGKSLGEIRIFLTQARERYEKLLNAELIERDLKKESADVLENMRELSKKISLKRQKAAREIDRDIEKELLDLELKHAAFSIDFQNCDYTLSGADQIEFMIRLNAGQPMMPLRSIISAGEVARVMLALKKTLAKVDGIPTLIFDEIDANIGGRLGQITGRKLFQIAESHQVLLITHLPQIASFADRHFKVSKSVKGGETAISYQRLEGDARVEELSQMMSGKGSSEISLEHAREMLRISKR